MEKNLKLIPKICKIEYATLIEITSIIEDSSKHHRNIDLVASWNNIYLTPGSMNYKEDSKQSSAGTYYEQKASGFFPGMDESNLPAFDNMENQRFVVKLTYNSGIVKVFGDLENPAQFQIDFSTDKDGYDILFYRSGIDKAYLFE